VSARGEREGKSTKDTTGRRKRIPKNAPKALGPVGSSERQRPAGRGEPAHAELGWPSRIPREDSNGRMIF
jgi:hypothetical protein